jgi:hypothetical protein
MESHQIARNNKICFVSVISLTSMSSRERVGEVFLSLTFSSLMEGQKYKSTANPQASILTYRHQEDLIIWIRKYEKYIHNHFSSVRNMFTI